MAFMTCVSIPMHKLLHSGSTASGLQAVMRLVQTLHVVNCLQLRFAIPHAIVVLLLCLTGAFVPCCTARVSHDRVEAERRWHGLLQVVALVTDGAQRPDIPAVENLPGPGNFDGYPEYITLMEQCWHQDPAARPTFTQVCCNVGRTTFLDANDVY